MKVLVGCESSGVVRDAFLARGHDAVSCDLLPTDQPGPHWQMDVFEALERRTWDLFIVHPPCTHLAVSGAAWFAQKRADGRQQQALAFVGRLFDYAKANRLRMVLENPVSIISSHFRKPDQIIHPHMFGHPEQKTTCLWLVGDVPLLVPTNDVYAEMLKLPKNQRERLHYLPPTPDRWKLRSATFPGIAAAMADQYGSYIPRQLEMAL